MCCKMSMKVVLLCSLVIATVFRNDFTNAFMIPDIHISILQPRGFQAWVDDVPGMTRFSFHGAINRELLGREEGSIQGIVRSRSGGFWVFEDRNSLLEVNDTLYYWAIINYVERGKRRAVSIDDRRYDVTDEDLGNFYNSTEDVTLMSSTSTTFEPTSTITSTTQHITSTCSNSISTVRGQTVQVCSGELIFIEQFDGQLNAKRWTTEVRFPQEPDYEFVVYMKSNRRTQNGKLIIQPTLLEDAYGVDFVNERLDLGSECSDYRPTKECTKTAHTYQILPPVISSRITTKDNFSFKYGTIEISAKLPEGYWIYPQLYLEPQRAAYGQSDLISGLMRIAYTAGNPDKVTELFGGVLLGTSDVARSTFMKVKNHHSVGWSNSFHIYKLHWTPDSITISVDGTVYNRIFPPSNGFSTLKSSLHQPLADAWRKGSVLAPFDEEFYISLGVGVGGLNFPDQMFDKPWKNTGSKRVLNFWEKKRKWFPSWKSSASALIVEYIKVYAL